MRVHPVGGTPVVLVIVLVLGLLAAVVGITAVVRIQRHPVTASSTASRLAADSVALFALGITFLTLGIIFFYGWLPVGIVFLAVGARLRHKSKSLRG
jgi:hypothetical protein